MDILYERLKVLKGAWKEPFAIKICHECKGEMHLVDIDGPDLCQDMEWYCTECGITESYLEWSARVGARVFE